MPIQYRILPTQYLVQVRAYDVLTEQEMFGYQHEVWSQSEVQGFNELLEMTDVTEIVRPETHKIQALATLSSAMEQGPMGKFAVVAPSDYAYGLARMYQTYRSMTPNGQKEIGVFRNMDDALNFLEVDVKLPPWDS